MNTPILFCDLDNTLISTQSGKTFPIHTKDWKFIDETVEAIDFFIKKGYKIVIVTNQGGINLGFLTEKRFINKIEEICIRLEKLLKLRKNSISYKYCKSIDEDNYNRKPNAGMAIDYILDNEASLKNSIMFGDTENDKEFALNAGISQYYSITDIINFLWKD